MPIETWAELAGSWYRGKLAPTGFPGVGGRRQTTSDRENSNFTVVVCFLSSSVALVGSIFLREFDLPNRLVIV